jgi:hypothetical protein
MFIGSYDIDGDPKALLAAYDRLVAGIPPEAVDLHMCVTHAHGITVYDACPSQSDFQAFSASAEFAAALAGAGLPAPRVTELGEVYRARIREAVG